MTRQWTLRTNNSSWIQKNETKENEDREKSVSVLYILNCDSESLIII